MNINYQLKERTIYSESDLLHFGEREIFGDIVNTHFPDYAGIQIGAVLYEHTNAQKVKDLKSYLELKRMRTSNEMLIAFFDDDSLAKQFYTAAEFTKLQEFYKQEFDLSLKRISHNIMEVVGKGFYIPPTASDQQVATIQQLLNIYFFTIEENTTATLASSKAIDWEKRWAILYQKDLEVKEAVKPQPAPVSAVKPAPKVAAQAKAPARPWWKFW